MGMSQTYGVTPIIGLISENATYAIVYCTMMFLRLTGRKPSPSELALRSLARSSRKTSCLRDPANPDRSHSSMQQRPCRGTRVKVKLRDRVARGFSPRAAAARATRWSVVPGPLRSSATPQTVTQLIPIDPSGRCGALVEHNGGRYSTDAWGTRNDA